MDKTLAFYHKQDMETQVAGVRIRSVLVKYLGIYLGKGDLLKLNFKKPLKATCLKIQAWNKRYLSLPARITILKTFIFSLFVHVINTVWIAPEQLEVIKKMLNDFLWQGRNKVKHSTMCAPIKLGSLNMIHVKNIVHSLQVQFMDRLCKDVGSSWSRYVWPKVSDIVPPDLIGGARLVQESYLTSLTPFYHSMVRSFVYVNNLFCWENKELSLPLNLWFITGMPSVNKTWLLAGFHMVLDLPIKSGKISITAVKSALLPTDPHMYHKCYQF